MTENKYDAVLVLGGGINLDGTLSDDVKTQIEKAVELFEQHSVGALIFSGLYGYKNEQKLPISEARAYAQYAQSLGVDAGNIYIEERSQETLGNILFTKMEILIPHGWTRILVVPQINHLGERIDYLLQKILGPGYEWTVVRPGVNQEEKNVAREMKSLELTKQINDVFEDGDHQAIYDGLMASHPAYGGTLKTIEELREILG